MESVRQRYAIQTLLTFWNELNLRKGGSRPRMDGRKLNTMIFTNTHKMDGATVSVLMLMDWDNGKAVDALSLFPTQKRNNILVAKYLTQMTNCKSNY